MSTNQTHGSSRDDDLLARALAALKHTPMADGPSAETLARTQAALEAAASSFRPTLFPRRKTMFAILKLAAALLVAAGGLFYLGGPYLVGAPVAFEEVAQRLQNAHSFAYLMTMELPGVKTPVAVQLRIREPGLLRSEAVPAGGPVIIFDQKAGKRLVLNPATKTAVLLDGSLPGEPKGAGPDQAAGAAEGLRNLANKKGEPVGEKKIGQVQAQGFRVKEETGQEMVIWVDPQTKLPVQIDIKGKFGGGQAYHSTISDFQLDPRLDDSLFSFEPPQGYTLQKQNINVADDKDDGTPETAVARLLRMYAEKTGGKFPKRIDDWVDIGEKLKDEKTQSPSDPKMLQLVNLVVRVQILLLDPKGHYGYNADGVKLGDADKIVFWYQPKGKETYRAVFGDLHAADVAADRLPTVEKEQPKP